jgi:hypothetical protein
VIPMERSLQRFALPVRFTPTQPKLRVVAALVTLTCTSECVGPSTIFRLWWVPAMDSVAARLDFAAPLSTLLVSERVLRVFPRSCASRVLGLVSRATRMGPKCPECGYPPPWLLPLVRFVV